MHVEALGVLYYTMYMHEELEYTHSIIHGLVTVIIKINFVSVARVYYTCT